MIIINTFWSQDKLRKAEVYKNKEGVYCVNMFENIIPDGMTLVDTKEFPNKSLYYVEDSAENYVMYIH